MTSLLAMVDRTYPCDHAFLEEVMSRELPLKNIPVTFVMRSKYEPAGVFKQWNRSEVFIIKGGQYRSLKHAAGNLAGLLRSYSALKGIIKKKGIDALFVRNDPIMGLLGIRLARTLRLPLFFQISHLKEEELIDYSRKGLLSNRFLSSLKGHLGIFLRRLILERSNQIIPISDTMVDYFVQKGIPPGKMTALPLGANVETNPDRETSAMRLRDRLGLNRDSRLLLYLGTFIRVRKLEIMIAAFAKTEPFYPNTYLVMLGGDANPGDTSYLKRTADSMGVRDKVIFAGRVTRAEVPGYIKGVDIGLSPFPNSWILKMNSPMKLMEYLGCGIPVVATNIPEQQTIIRGSGAGICVHYDVNSFADGMRTLLDMDRKELRRLGDNGRSYMEIQRSYSIIADFLENIITETLGGSAKIEPRSSGITS